MKFMRLSLCGWLFILSLMAGKAFAQGQPLADDLEKIRTQYGLPAIAAAVVKDGTIIASGVAGVRVDGTSIAATIDDRFHLGSDTKAMTATLAAMLVEEGKLKWTSTIGEVLGADVPGINPKLAAVTLEQLLSHTSGIPSDTAEIVKLYYSTDAFQYNLRPAAPARSRSLERSRSCDRARHGVSLRQSWISDCRSDDREGGRRALGITHQKANFRTAGIANGRPRPTGDHGEIRCAGRTPDWR